MKNLIHRIATYSAVVLISAMPFTLDADRDPEKDRNELTAGLTLVEKDMLLNKRRFLPETED